MAAAAEREVRVRIAARRRSAPARRRTRRVAVRGGEHRPTPGCRFGMRLPPNSVSSCDDAHRQRDRPVVAQAFLDGARHAAPGRPAAGELVGMARRAPARRCRSGRSSSRSRRSRGPCTARRARAGESRSPASSARIERGEHVVARVAAPRRRSGPRSSRRSASLAAMPRSSTSGGAKIAASRCVASAVQRVKRSRSPTGTPIISQIIVDGTGSARSRDHVELAARKRRVDRSSRDLGHPRRAASRSRAA